MEVERDGLLLAWLQPDFLESAESLDGSCGFASNLWQAEVQLSDSVACDVAGVGD